jgi:hypothetical protein
MTLPFGKNIMTRVVVHSRPGQGGENERER